MWSVFKETRGMQNKLAVLWKGPGWAPGKPRTGLIEDIPDVRIFLEHLISPVHYMYVVTLTLLSSSKRAQRLVRMRYPFTYFFYKIYVGKYILEMTIKQWNLTGLICHCLFLLKDFLCERIGFIIVQNF